MNAAQEQTIHFRFGGRTITATGAQSDPDHPNVLRLSIRASSLHRIVRALVHPLPLALRSWVQSAFPAWLLPANIVLKKQKDKGEEDFETEENTYHKLQCVQGHVIPICYGQIEYDGTRALILSDVGGACLATPEGAVLSKQELKPLLREALGALAKFGIRHDDLKLDNFHLVSKHRNRIIVIDLERIDPLSPDLVDWVIEKDANILMRAYQDHLDSLHDDGF